MPRRSQREAVAERAEARLEEQRQRRREAAQRGAQTRRERREAQAAEAQPQAGAESRTQGRVARRSRPRVHADLVTVAIRGHFAERMRALSETHGMSLAKLLKDALLVYEGQIDAGYEPGTSLRRWQESQAEGEERAE
jgi:hypothetical protein